MKKILVLVLVALMILPAAALADEVVNVFNWYDYIDESVFEQFTEETYPAKRQPLFGREREGGERQP